jgi:hypothetical protein
MSAARLLAGLVGLLVLVGGCGFAVVGDRCPGLVECDPQSPGDAGRFDRERPDGTPLPDPTRPDGGGPDDSGSRPDGDPQPTDGAPGDDASGLQSDGPPAATDGPCPTGEQLCNGRCTAAFTDPDNCGSCGHVCLSGICLSGACQDAAWGHLVLLGHDFAHPGANETRELANAVFLSLASPVRVAVYREHAADATVARTLANLTAEATRRGRSFLPTVFTDWAAFTAALSGFETALVVPQDQASNDALCTAAVALEASLLSFVRSGGALVVLDGPPAANAGTWQLVRNLAAVTGLVDVTGAYVTVAQPTDGVALGLTTNYLAAARTAAFSYTGPGGVATTGSGPTLIHEIVPP